MAHLMSNYPPFLPLGTVKLLLHVAGIFGRNFVAKESAKCGLSQESRKILF